MVAAVVVFHSKEIACRHCAGVGKRHCLCFTAIDSGSVAVVVAEGYGTHGCEAAHVVCCLVAFEG